LARLDRPGGWRRSLLLVYGDFTCPYSYLASQRADALSTAGLAEVQWRAVEHDRAVPPAGRLAPVPGTCQLPLRDLAPLARPDERVPDRAPPVTSNTHAAVYLYSWTAPEVRPLLRRRLFEAIWTLHLPVSSVEDLLGLLGGQSLAPAPWGSTEGRLNRWRREWQALPGRYLPAVVRPTDGVVVTGPDALAYLAGLLTRPA
jgi:hypothetical protein